MQDRESHKFDDVCVLVARTERDSRMVTSLTDVCVLVAWRTERETVVDVW